MEPVIVPEDHTLSTRVELTTRWSDEDNQGVLNNAVYLTLLEEARLVYFRALGLLEPSGAFPFVLAQCQVRFVAPGRGGQGVVVHLGTVHLGTTSFEQVYRVRSVADGAIWCEARALLVAWDNRARAKRPLSAEFRAAVRAHEQL